MLFFQPCLLIPQPWHAHPALFVDIACLASVRLELMTSHRELTSSKEEGLLVVQGWYPPPPRGNGSKGEKDVVCEIIIFYLHLSVHWKLTLNVCLCLPSPSHTLIQKE